MKNNIIQKIAYIIIVLIIVSFVPISIYAASKTELENKSHEIDKKIELQQSERRQYLQSLLLNEGY